MGRCPNNKAGGQKKKYSHKQARRTKFLKKGDDIIFDAIRCHALADAPLASSAVGEASHAAAGSALPPADEDLPGMGQWYCLFCDRHFAAEAVRDEHNKTKLHKKRVKMMKAGPRPHSQLDADLAAGMGQPDHGSKTRQPMCASPSPMVQ